MQYGALRGDDEWRVHVHTRDDAWLHSADAGTDAADRTGQLRGSVLESC